MTTDDLIRALAKAEKISQPKAKKLIKSFIGSLELALKNNDKVCFSNFGTFLTHRYPSKTIYDPQGRGHKLLMLPTNVIKWHPSPQVREKVNKVSFWGGLFHHSDSDKGNDEISKPLSPQEPEEKQPETVVINKLEKAAPPVQEESPEIQPEEAAKSDIEEPSNKVSETNTDSETISSPNLGETTESSGKADTPENIATIDESTQLKSETDSPNNDDIAKQVADESHLKLTDNQISEATESEKPRISFEDFVKNSKAEGFSFSEDQPAKIADKPDLSAEPTELKAHKPKSEIQEKGQPFIGRVSIEFVDLSKKEIDKKILATIPEEFARQYQVVPIADTGRVLTVGMVDPEDLEAIELIKKQTGREVIPKLAVMDDIGRILDQYSGVETEVTEAISASEKETKEAIEPESKADKNAEKLTEDAPVSRIVQSLIKRAVRELASDIHIEPFEEGLDVRFRVDGILHKKISIPKDIQASVISRVKILAGIKIDESRLPQDGRIQLQIDSRKVDFRVSTMPTAYGEKIVMRILDKSTGILTLEDLGLRGKGFDIVVNGIHKSHGMTLVTGPTGSGKTTTLYAVIDRLLDVTVNIVTLEDPIEYQVAGINQSQVNSEIDYTFANGLRSILRQDPDVVMIGEIRDKETAEMAVNAALTGHVVLSTLHTNDAAGAGPRLIDMGVEPFLITSSLNTVIGQRLTRKICKNCKEETKIADKELAEVKAEIAKMPEEVKKRWNDKPLVFFQGKGCSECTDTGYKGRMGIFEVLDINEKIQDLLINRVTSSKLTEAGIADGMLTMKQDGIDKALDGLTSLEEIWRVTKD